MALAASSSLSFQIHSVSAANKKHRYNTFCLIFRIVYVRLGIFHRLFRPNRPASPSRDCFVCLFFFFLFTFHFPNLQESPFFGHFHNSFWFFAKPIFFSSFTPLRCERKCQESADQPDFNIDISLSLNINIYLYNFLQLLSTNI